MNLSFDQLKSMVIFAQVVDQGSLSAAARHLGLTRAVVSYHIKRLERELKVSLLNRTTRSLSLTDAGKHYYQHCHVIATEAEAAQRQVAFLRDEVAGTLRLTCPVNAGLQLVVPVLDQFKKRYPEVVLDVIFTDDVVDLVKEGVDLAVRGAPMPDSGLKATRLTRMATMICGSPAYFRRYGKPVQVEQLARHQWVNYSKSAGKITLIKGGKTYVVSTPGTILTNNAAARTAFVVGGHGLARIPAYDARPRIDAGELEAVLEDYELPPIEIYGVFPPGATQVRKVRLLVDFMKGYFQSF